MPATHCPQEAKSLNSARRSSGLGRGPLVAALLLLAACRAEPPEAVLGEAAPAAAPRTVVDDTGQTLHLPEHPQRVVCLAPNLTQISFALGAGSSVVGVSDYSDRPILVEQLPRVGPMGQPGIEVILSLRPDLVLASSDGNPLASLHRLRELGLPVFGVDPKEPGLGAVRGSVEAVARALGREAEGRALLTDMDARLQTASERSRLHGASPGSACFLLSTQPLIAAGQGTFLDDLLELVGVENSCAVGGEEYPRLSREELLLLQPDSLFLLVGGEAGTNGSALLGDWAVGTRAVKARRVLHLDSDLFSRPTHELGGAAEELARILGSLPVRGEAEAGP